MYKKILVSMFVLAILMIGGGTYLIYYGINQIDNKNEAKKEEKKGYVRDPDLGKETDFTQEFIDKQPAEARGRLAFLEENYQSEIPDENSFSSRVDLVEKYTAIYFELLAESREMQKNSYGQDFIEVPAYDVNVVMEGVGAYRLEEENTMKMLQRNFNIADQQQKLYNEKMEEYANAGPGPRVDIQVELDTIERRFPEIEKSNADLFENFFPYL
ncbi:hypothetical protein [Exiguobacterium acetylicum]|uniref:hypothetical protein n=1 Tax=Exiguobacterium acetylicum TaxID=41170 RepID=UPI001EE3A122|nr:hypothetical protein [Exiguobacterium acetylicum]UKS57760.1 hypothetical protein K6T22_16880 [Exiguobacterium acetylicum]